MLFIAACVSLSKRRICIRRVEDDVERRSDDWWEREWKGTGCDFPFWRGFLAPYLQFFVSESYSSNQPNI